MTTIGLLSNKPYPPKDIQCSDRFTQLDTNSETALGAILPVKLTVRELSGDSYLDFLPKGLITTELLPRKKKLDVGNCKMKISPSGLLKISLIIINQQNNDAIIFLKLSRLSRKCVFTEAFYLIGGEMELIISFGRKETRD